MSAKPQQHRDEQQPEPPDHQRVIIEQYRGPLLAGRAAAHEIKAMSYASAFDYQRAASEVAISAKANSPGGASPYVDVPVLSRKRCL